MTDQWGPPARTALEILIEARRLAADEYEWNKWEKRRLAEKESNFGDNLLPRGEWCVMMASQGAMRERVIAEGVLKEVMGMDLRKYTERYTHAENLAMFDKAVAKLKKT
jgi:hypothetical protein